MAGFYQHVSVSTALGVGYGVAAYHCCGIDWATCAIAGGLTGLAGMLPDLDSPTGQPVREMFGFAAALVPVLFIKELSIAVATAYESFTSEPAEMTPQAMVVIIAACYFAVRFGGAWLLDRLTVHRGMFHSIPAALIVAVGAFLLLSGPSFKLRLFLAGGPLLGFLSHLIMDEIWSVKMGGGGEVGLKKSAGTAFKLFSGSIPATAITYSILLGLCYLLLRDPGVSNVLRRSGTPDVPRVVEELIDTVRR